MRTTDEFVGRLHANLITNPGAAERNAALGIFPMPLEHMQNQLALKQDRRPPPAPGRLEDSNPRSALDECVGFEIRIDVDRADNGIFVVTDTGEERLYLARLTAVEVNGTPTGGKPLEAKILRAGTRVSGVEKSVVTDRWFSTACSRSDYRCPNSQCLDSISQEAVVLCDRRLSIAIARSESADYCDLRRFAAAAGVRRSSLWISALVD
jgi:hypothetical protein